LNCIGEVLDVVNWRGELDVEESELTFDRNFFVEESDRCPPGGA